MRIIFYCLLMTLCPTAFADPAFSNVPILSDSSANGQTNYQSGEPGEARPVVIDVVLHNREAILNMLKRAEMLATSPNSADRPQQIALVLHGQEIDHFRISKYSENKEIVDLAAKLDAFNVIDIKMCNTMMGVLNVDRQEVPAFIDIVPYGPTEVKQLEKKGFLKL